MHQIRKKSLVLLPSVFFSLHGVNADLLIVLLQGGHVLPGLGEFALLHALAHVPVDKGPLGVHEVKLMVEPGPGLSDGGGVGQHADGTLDLSKVTSWNNSWWLIVDSYLEASLK